MKNPYCFRRWSAKCLKFLSRHFLMCVITASYVIFFIYMVCKRGCFLNLIKKKYRIYWSHASCPIQHQFLHFVFLVREQCASRYLMLLLCTKDFIFLYLLLASELVTYQILLVWVASESQILEKWFVISPFCRRMWKHLQWQTLHMFKLI